MPLCSKCKGNGINVDFYWNEQDRTKSGKARPYETETGHVHDCPFSDYAISTGTKDVRLKELNARLLNAENKRKIEEAKVSTQTNTTTIPIPRQVQAEAPVVMTKDEELTRKEKEGKKMLEKEMPTEAEMKMVERYIDKFNSVVITTVSLLKETLDNIARTQTDTNLVMKEVAQAVFRHSEKVKDLTTELHSMRSDVLNNRAADSEQIIERIEVIRGRIGELERRIRKFPIQPIVEASRTGEQKRKDEEAELATDDSDYHGEKISADAEGVDEETFREEEVSDVYNGKEQVVTDDAEETVDADVDIDHVEPDLGERGEQ